MCFSSNNFGFWHIGSMGLASIVLTAGDGNNISANMTVDDSSSRKGREMGGVSGVNSRAPLRS